MADNNNTGSVDESEDITEILKRCKTLQDNSDKAIYSKVKITRKRIFIGVVILVVLFYAYWYVYWTEWRFEHVRLNMAAKEHLDDYQNYFYKAEQMRVRQMPSPFGGGGTCNKNILFTRTTRANASKDQGRRNH